MNTFLRIIFLFLFLTNYLPKVSASNRSLVWVDKNILPSSELTFPIIFFLNSLPEITNEGLRISDHLKTNAATTALVTKDSSSSKKHFVQVLILLFITITILVVIAIMMSRVYKLYCQFKTNRLRKKYELLLMDVLFSEGSEEDKLNTTKIVRHFQDNYLHSTFNREVLLAEIIRLHKNFSGDFATNLEHFYMALGFYKDSFTKMKSAFWHKKAQGICELANMNVKEAVPGISQYINHRNELVRLEAQLALVKLADDNLFGFLNHVTNPLSDWQQVNLQQALSHKSRQQIPEFQTWLNSSNATVVAFSAKMIGLYNQVDAMPELIAILNHPEKFVRKAVIAALQKLDAQEAVPALENLYETEDSELKLDILQALESIGIGVNMEFIYAQLLSEDFDIRLAAAKTIKALDMDETNYLQKLQPEADEALQHIIAHALDNRI